MRFERDMALIHTITRELRASDAWWLEPDALCATACP
jgi:hypothetical protein